MKYFSAFFLSALLAACAANPTASDEPTVVASIYPLGYAAEQVLGADASVAVVTPAGAEPHEFEPSPGQIAAALEADLFVYNGGGIDAWGDDIAAERTRDGKQSIQALGLYGKLLPADSHRSEFVSSDEAIAFDPHIWLDPDRLSTAGALIASKMSDIDPEHENEYLDRFEQFSSEMTALGQSYAEGLRDCELHDIIVSHGAYRYLAARFGFNVLMLGGLSPEDEGSLSNIVAIEQLAKQRGIRDVFAESEVGVADLEGIARDLGGTVRILNPIESATPEQLAGGEDYRVMMESNLASLRAALQCR